MFVHLNCCPDTVFGMRTLRTILLQTEIAVLAVLPGKGKAVVHISSRKPETLRKDDSFLTMAEPKHRTGERLVVHNQVLNLSIAHALKISPERSCYSAERTCLARTDIANGIKGSEYAAIFIILVKHQHKVLPGNPSIIKCCEGLQIVPAELVLERPQVLEELLQTRQKYADLVSSHILSICGTFLVCIQLDLQLFWQVDARFVS